MITLIKSANNTSKNDGKEKQSKAGIKRKHKGFVRFIAIAILLLIVTAVTIGIIYYSTEEISLEGYVNLEKAVEEKALEKITVYANDKYAKFKIKDDDTMHKAYYEDEYRLLDLVSESGAKVMRTDFSVWSVVEPVLCIGVIVVFGISMMSVIRSGVRVGSRPIENSLKVPKVTKKTTFKDIAGLDEIKERLMLVANMCKESSKTPKNIRIPRGILFDGAPGNGKTMLATAFANECGMNFIAINSSDMLKPFVGESERLINSIFDEAREKAPCVIFFDEFDAIGSKRSANTETGAAKGYNSLVNALLTQLDGVNDRKSIIVMAATNNADSLDRALIRPGRFDMRLTVTNPDKTARETLMRQYMHESTIDNNVDFANLVSLTEGMSCAQIETICNEAKIAAFARKSKTVSDDDFNTAILAASTNGLVKKETASEAERYNAAIHEAGHAIAAKYHSRKQVVRVSITPTTSGVGGYTETTYPEEASVRTLNDIRNELIILYGGKAAESLLRDDPMECSLGASNDIQVATQLATEYIRALDGVDYSIFKAEDSSYSKRIIDIIKEIQFETDECLRQHWTDVVGLANELLINDSIVI